MHEITLKNKFPNHMFSVINDPIKTETNPYILVLIPSKDRNDLLFNCMDSLSIHTSKNLTNINVCVIDTGSTPECIKEIKEYIADDNSHLMMSLEEQDYYNFAKNNNQGFKDQKGKQYDYVLFCNNDIQLLNDAIGHMIWTYENEMDVGTVGIRLHFGDGKIQHLGAFCQAQGENVSPGHYGFGKIITGSVLSGAQEVPANTCAFMMMKAPLFNDLLFSEEYLECFEDVQLNLEVGIKGFRNICNLNAAAFHFESMSRNKDPKKDQRQAEDMKKLSRFVMSNRNQPFIKSKVM